MRWNDSDGTVDLGLKGGNVTLQVGQEQVLRVVNKTATNINLLEANYQAVRVTGAQGQRLKVDLAQAINDTLSAETIGLVTETINNNQEGFIERNVGRWRYIIFEPYNCGKCYKSKTCCAKSFNYTWLRYSRSHNPRKYIC